MGYLMTKTFRKLRASDLDDMREIDRLSFRADELVPAEYYDAIVGDPVFECRVAVDLKDRMVGYLLIKKFPPPPLVFSSAVHPAHRGRGLARALFKSFLDETTGPIRLFVDAKNADAIAFYEHLGFERQPEQPGEGESKIKMTRF